MKEKKTGQNVKELYADDGTVFLLSYDVPVAAYVPGIGYVRTEERFSQTTTKHVNNWLRANEAIDRAMEVTQNGLEQLISRSRN